MVKTRIQIINLINMCYYFFKHPIFYLLDQKMSHIAKKNLNCVSVRDDRQKQKELTI